MEAFVSHMHDSHNDGKDIKVAAVLSWRLGTLMVSQATLATDGVSGTDGSGQMSRSMDLCCHVAFVRTLQQSKNE